MSAPSTVSPATPTPATPAPIRDHYAEALGVAITPKFTVVGRTRIYEEHQKELMKGSGLLPSTLIRANVFSTQDPAQKNYILSRGFREGTQNRGVLALTTGKKGMLCYPNPLFPDEVHSKLEMAADELGKPTYVYRTVFGSCKPPLVWAPQAKITDFNRGWLTERYGEKLVHEIDQRLTRYQDWEKARTVSHLAKGFEGRGFAPERAASLGAALFKASGLSRNYDALTDTDIPVEITEGQKKIYCMAQGREKMMFDQAFDVIGHSEPGVPDASLVDSWKSREWVEPCLFVCAPGVWNIAQKNPDPDHPHRYVVNESWRHVVDMTGREVHMTWDADAETNLDVAQAGSCTGEAMQRVYPGVNVQWRLYDPTKKIFDPKGKAIKIGADDFICHFGPEAFFAMPPMPIATGLDRDYIKREAESRKIGYLRLLQVVAAENPRMARPIEQAKPAVKAVEQPQAPVASPEL